MSSLERLHGMGGRTLDRAGVEQLASSLGIPQGLADILTTLPLIGVTMTLSEGEDLSGLGAALQWMGPEEMMSEARDVYPGIVALERGYFPVGTCVSGSGDPYFYRQSQQRMP